MVQASFDKKKTRRLKIVKITKDGSGKRLSTSTQKQAAIWPPEKYH
jgi:hypothetical protein